VFLLGTQLVLLAFGLATIVRRWELLDDLGRRVHRTLPGSLQSALGKPVAAIPVAVRHAFLGASHDPSQVQGLGMALLGVLAAMAIMSLVVGFARRRRSADLTRWPTSGRRLRRRVLASVCLVVFLGLLSGMGYLMSFDHVDGTSRTLRVSLWVKGEDDAIRTTAGTVTLRPIDRPENLTITRRIRAKDHLPVPIAVVDDVDYVISASGDDLKDCAPAIAGDIVDITCQPAAGILRHR